MARADLESKADYQRTYHRRRRLAAFDAYGGRCFCCGEARWQFLTFDRRSGVPPSAQTGTRGTEFVSWLYANNFPRGIQVLCRNCNAALTYYRECPHRPR